MAFDSSGGASKLAKVLTQRMKKCKESPLVLDFGEILPNMSLLTNTFPLEIPKGQYTICRSVSWNPAIPMTMTWRVDEAPSVQGWEEEDWSEKAWQGGPVDLHNPPVSVPHMHGKKGEHDHGSCPTGQHYHDVYLPDKMRWIKPGDRVLVAWVEDEAVVIDIVLNSEILGS